MKVFDIVFIIENFNNNMYIKMLMTYCFVCDILSLVETSVDNLAGNNSSSIKSGTLLRNSKYMNVHYSTVNDLIILVAQ